MDLTTRITLKIVDGKLLINEDGCKGCAYNLGDWAGQTLVENVCDCLRNYLLYEEEYTSGNQVKFWSYMSDMILGKDDHNMKNDLKNFDKFSDESNKASSDMKKWQKDVLNGSDAWTCGQPNDPVNHPSHYTDGKIEVIDFIEDKKLGFHLGNAVKYICRAGKKNPNKELEDLQKARWYLDRWIEHIQQKQASECTGYTAPNNERDFPINLCGSDSASSADNKNDCVTTLS